MSDKHFFETVKTARYFTHNNLTENTQTIWILIHGYAQTAEDMIKPFEVLDSRNFVIAPEGLNKFYSRGFGGVPVANWMTSLEREQDIKDYIYYLNNLIDSFNLALNSKAKILLVGFSQGVATCSRWIQATTHTFTHFVMVAGDIANEMHTELPAKFNHLPKTFLIGNSDSLIKEEKVNLLKNLLAHNTPFLKFEGNHEINASCFEQLVQISQTI